MTKNENEWWYDEGESIANGADAYDVIKRIVAESRRRTIEEIENKLYDLEMLGAGVDIADIVFYRLEEMKK